MGDEPYHLAVKEVNLPKELHTARGITLPPWTRQATKTVDITKHAFDVALSFPGEVRDIVLKVAQELKAGSSELVLLRQQLLSNWRGPRSTRSCRTSIATDRSSS